jgi:excisionase family DNA binding protein
MTDLLSKASNRPMGGFHTVKETAQRLRLCEKQVRRLLASGQLTAYRFGSAIRIQSEDLNRYISQNKIWK